MSSLESIRTRFAHFETSTTPNDTITVNFTKQFIIQQLADGAHTLAALDPTGQSTNEQMQARLDAAQRRGHLVGARANFAAFETTTIVYDDHIISSIKKIITEQLAAGGHTLAALDPMDRSTGEEMQARLDAAARRAHLISARANFVEFEMATTPYDRLTVNFIIGKITDHLSAGGHALAALDTTGKSTDKQMQARLDAVVTRVLPFSYRSLPAPFSVSLPSSSGFTNRLDLPLGGANHVDLVWIIPAKLSPPSRCSPQP